MFGVVKVDLVVVVVVGGAVENGNVFWFRILGTPTWGLL